MDNYIPISFLNDFVFCPRSIYNHILYGNFEENLYQEKVQREGKDAHTHVDNKTYSDKKNVLQNFEVVTAHYGIYGKIDIFDIDKGLLSERKKNIKTIYDGYIFQVYAQYFGLIEMGFDVRKIVLYDFTKNKSHSILLPTEDQAMLDKFEQTVDEIKNYSLLKPFSAQNILKCEKCIYKQLCDASLC